MRRILLIDSAGAVTSVGFAINGRLEKALYAENEGKFSIHEAISQLAGTGLFNLEELDAIAVTAGPGSYTGLRVAMAAAKGLCYSLGKNLILANTLESMARGLVLGENETASLLCPMIDARRDEVFMALYDRKFNMVLPPQPLILTSDSLSEWMEKHEILFAGSGAPKWADHSSRKVSLAARETNVLLGLAMVADQKLINGNIADLMYSEPDYLKEFYSPGSRNL